MGLPVSRLPMDFAESSNVPKAQETDELNWIRITSAAALVSGGALILAGKTRLGLAAAAAGTTMAVIDQQEAVKKFWAVLPGYIADLQHVLRQVQETVDEVAAQREKLGRVLGDAAQRL